MVESGVRAAALTRISDFGVRVLSGPDAGREASAKSGRLSIGSSPGSDLRLGDRSIGQDEVELIATGDGILLRDRGAVPSIKLGGHLIKEMVVREPIELGIGHARVQLHFGTETRAIDPTRFGELVGGSESMREVFALLRRAAPSLAPILISGESGTGKELAARAVHANSLRAVGSFEVVDCAGLSPRRIESELFGYEPESPSNARGDGAGAFERAYGGTLFLDELAELPLELQPRLLRAISQREIRRNGGIQRRHTDVRIVASTSRDLRADVKEGRFRPELYYRVAVVQITLPPLRERIEDLPLLLAAVLDDIGPGRDLPAEFDLEQLSRHSWPGNVRELRNYLEQMLVLGTVPHIDVGFESSVPSASGLSALPLHAALECFERDYTLRVLEENGGNVARAARRAGVNRATMFRIISKHGIKKA
jgi:DNA-binding NtrC family response regulator